MAYLSKIKVGDTSYSIFPSLGSALFVEEDILCLSLGSGIAFNDNKELILNYGTGLDIDKISKKAFVSIGTAKAENNPDADTGIAITKGGFTINATAFKSYLQSLGVMFY